MSFELPSAEADGKRKQFSALAKFVFYRFLFNKNHVWLKPMIFTFSRWLKPTAIQQTYNAHYLIYFHYSSVKKKS